MHVSLNALRLLGWWSVTHCQVDIVDSLRYELLVLQESLCHYTLQHMLSYRFSYRLNGYNSAHKPGGVCNVRGE